MRVQDITVAANFKWALVNLLQEGRKAEELLGIQWYMRHQMRWQEWGIYYWNLWLGWCGFIQILQPLTQNSLPLNGTGVNTWACHVVVLVLKQRRSLHHHLLYSQLLTPEFDDTVSCLLKALQPTCDYVSSLDCIPKAIRLMPVVVFGRCPTCLRFGISFSFHVISIWHAIIFVHT